MPKILRVVVFGDSLSDIGRMANRAVGKFAVINKWGRFSDGRNWVDRLWEAMSEQTMFLTDDVADTKKRSQSHLTIAKANDGAGSSKMELANYAEGGALASSSTEGLSGSGSLTASILSSLNAQVAAYLEDRKVASVANRVREANTLHILWAGANDVVTVNRDKRYMPHVAQTVFALARLLLDSVPGSHVVMIDLPDPRFMPRFEKDKQDRLKAISAATELFNVTLDAHLTTEVEFDYLPARSSIGIMQMSKLLSPQALGAEGFAPFAQTKKDGVGSSVGAARVESASLLANTDVWFDEDSEFATVKDLLHPTQGVYTLIAQHVLAYLDQNKYTFGP